MKNLNSVLWGLVLVLLGVIFALNALDITNINIFFDGWWTLFIIVPCLIGLFTDDDKVGNSIGLIIGTFLFLCSRGLLSFDLIWKLLIPAILIIIGLSMIFKNFLHNDLKKIEKENTKEYCATFSNQKFSLEDSFEGAEITAVFGGVDFNIQDAKIEEDVVIDVTAIFGEVVISLPKNVKVKMVSTPIFGSNNNSRKNSKDDKVTVYVKATSLFGGVKVR